MMALTRVELFAKEAVYHESCYFDWTIVLYEKAKVDNNDADGSEVTFEVVKDKLIQLCTNLEYYFFKLQLCIKTLGFQNPLIQQL